MIKTLKITTLVAAILCVVLVVTVTVFGRKGDPKIEEFLDSPSIIEELKKVLGQTNIPADQISPLVKQAQAFALRIDPPPPPVAPPGPKKGPTTVARVQPTYQPPTPKGSVKPTGKFELIATCRYEDAPHKSLALLSLPAKGYKWFRVGENVDHLVIAEIKDGSIVMSQGSGGTESLVEMKQTPSTIRSLLAGADQNPVSISSQFSNVSAYTASQMGDRSRTRVRTPVPTTPRPPATRRTAYVPPSRTRRPPIKETLEQRKASLDENNGDIKKIVGTQDPKAGDKQVKEEQDALQKLLELLQNERKASDVEAKKPAESGATKE